VAILKEFLVHGASVHIRNREGHTPLFLAANAGLKEHVEALKEAGAHLHPDEMAAARLQATTGGEANSAWAQAGTDLVS
jgi:lysophospholipase